jgi:RNase P/RNase MRP subunit p29
MFTIRTDGKTVRIPKEKSSFLLQLPEKRAFTIDGDSLRHRPENRIKKAIGKW